MKFLTVQDVQLIHMQIIDASGGSQGTRDDGRLQSVIAATRQEVFGIELYKNVYEKSAALARGIIGDHPFVDGNKRTGIMAALVFLNLNNVDTTCVNSKDLEDFAVQIAVEHLDVEQIASWLQQNSGKA